MDIILDSGLAIRTWSGGILIGRKTYAVGTLKSKVAFQSGHFDGEKLDQFFPGGRSIELLDGSKPLRERAEKAIEDYNQGKGFHGHIE